MDASYYHDPGVGVSFKGNLFTKNLTIKMKILKHCSRSTLLHSYMYNPECAIFCTYIGDQTFILFQGMAALVLEYKAETIFFIFVVGFFVKRTQVVLDLDLLMKN
jgi:hypothetical protein